MSKPTIESAFKQFDAYDFSALNRLLDLSGAYQQAQHNTEALVREILRPLRDHATAVMRPHLVECSKGSAGFSMGRDPMPALSGFIMPNADRGGFYGNYPTIQFSCVVKTRDEFLAFWRAMRVATDALAATEIFVAASDPQPHQSKIPTQPQGEGEQSP